MSDFKEEEIEKQKEVKEDKTTWWTNVPKVVWVIVAIVGIIVLYNMSQAANKTNYWLIIGGIFAILVILAMRGKEVYGPLRPEEAEALVDISLARKVRWGEIPQNTKWRVTHVNMPWKTDGEGQFYSIGASLELPYTLKEIQIEARVPMRGDERGYVYMRETSTRILGGELKPEKRVLSNFYKDMKGMGLLDKMVGKVIQ